MKNQQPVQYYSQHIIYLNLNQYDFQQATLIVLKLKTTMDNWNLYQELT